MMQINVLEKLWICLDQRVHVLNALFDSSIVSHSPYRNAKLFHNNMLDLNEKTTDQMRNYKILSQQVKREIVNERHAGRCR